MARHTPAVVRPSTFTFRPTPLPHGSHNGRIPRYHLGQSGQVGVCHCDDIRRGCTLHSAVHSNLHGRGCPRVFHVRVSRPSHCQHAANSLLVSSLPSQSNDCFQFVKLKTVSRWGKLISKLI